MNTARERFRILYYLSFVIIAVFVTACDDEESNDDGDVKLSESGDISILKDKFYNTDQVTFTFDDNWVTITSKGQPDHKSVYYPTGHALYENYTIADDAEFMKNPNEIGEQNLVFKIPRFPSEAASKSETPMGPMGISINSVVFFNQQAAPQDDIFDEIKTFDKYNGHPAGDLFHYHIEPIWVTELKGNDAFLGFLLDGFPVYGPMENGAVVTALDDYHGHVSVTADFPDGIYHYHITEEFPWINGAGFYGTKGTVSQ